MMQVGGIDLYLRGAGQGIKIINVRLGSSIII